MAAVKIPTIDMTQVSGEELLGGLLDASCVFLTGIGSIPSEADDAIAVSDAFFSLSEQDKAQVQWSGSGPWAGWQPLYAAGGDALLLERYEVALPNPDSFASNEHWTATFDQWPSVPPALSSVWARYYRSMWALTERIVTLLVDALGLPTEDLPAWTHHQHSNLCVNHYLAQIEPPNPGQVRQRPHTDQGGLTLLWADGRGGLEAELGGDGTWVPVEFPPDSLLLQAGDLLHLWSRGRIPANNHRVVNPPRGDGIAQNDRYSLVFFHHPDLDTWVAPPGDDGRGVSARDHVMARQRKAYSMD